VKTIRVLFGAAGWPCGVLEIASWAVHEGLAEAVVAPVEPGPTAAVPGAEQSGVSVLGDRENEEPLRAIRGFSRRRGLGDRLVEEDGSPSAATREALAAVGGRFIQRLIEYAPHVVGFRIDGGQLEEVKGWVRAVRLFCQAEVVLGGPTATSHPVEVLEETGADYVFAGEAEEPFNRFLRLARQRNSKDRAGEIPGLAYRHGGRLWHNTLPGDGYERSRADIDHALGGTALRRLRNAVRPVAPAGVIAANRLDWSLLEGFERVEFESLFFTGGRGCPGACTFCAKLHGGEVRVKSAPQLLAEIEGADRMVAAGALRVQRWDLFKHVDDRELRPRRVAWVAVYDEDFFLHRKRAVEFFELWDRSPLNERYRLSLQTNPCSLLTSRGAVHAELLEWIDRLKPMVQLGAESFHPEVLARWNKRHDVGQLNAVLDALDKTGQDYTVFQLLTDFDTTAEELVESLRRLILAAYRRRRMRVASSPLTIPLYDSETRRLLEHDRRPGAGRAGHFTDYERPQPGWMDPLVADLADRADAELQWALEPEHRDGALLAAFEAVLDRVREERHRIGAAAGRGGRLWIGQLHDQALRALDQIKEARFQAIRPIG